MVPKHCRGKRHGQGWGNLPNDALGPLEPTAGTPSPAVREVWRANPRRGTGGRKVDAREASPDANEDVECPCGLGKVQRPSHAGVAGGSVRQAERHVGGAGNGVRQGDSKALFAEAGLFTHRSLAKASRSRWSNYRLESCMRENRTYSSEGGDGGSRSRPLFSACSALGRSSIVALLFCHGCRTPVRS